MNNVPEFITPKDILQMKPEQVYDLVTGIRNRILVTKIEYEALLAAKEAVQDAKIRAMIEKLATQFAKALVRADDACDKLEAIAHKISARHLQQEEQNDGTDD
jgi:hypothetical protein